MSPSKGRPAESAQANDAITTDVPRWLAGSPGIRLDLTAGSAHSQRIRDRVRDTGQAATAMRCVLGGLRRSTRFIPYGRLSGAVTTVRYRDRAPKGPRKPRWHASSISDAPGPFVPGYLAGASRAKCAFRATSAPRRPSAIGNSQSGST
jgi:hypothetical protein